MGERRGWLWRSRWAAVGAALAVVIGAGGIRVSQATIGSGERPVFVGITPCRLFDTRPAPDRVGTGGAFTPQETRTFTARNVAGNCLLPTDATAVALNVTAVDATAPTFLTFFPADQPRPLASNLNPQPGAPPTPNKVDVKLSSTGQFKVFNLTGSVNVLADVVGYYADHDHDDRYLQKAEVQMLSGGTDWMSLDGAAPPLVVRANGWTFVSGAGHVLAPLAGPVAAGSQSFGLFLVTYCIQTDGTTYVDGAVVRDAAAREYPTVELASDGTDRAATGCYTLTVSPPTGAHVMTLDLQIGQSAGVDPGMNLFDVRSVWVPIA